MARHRNVLTNTELGVLTEVYRIPLKGSARRYDVEMIIRRIFYVWPIKPNFRRANLILFTTILYPLRRR